MVGWEVGLVTSVSQGPLLSQDSDGLSVWPTGRTSEHTWLASQGLSDEDIPWPRRKRQAHRNTSYLEKDYYKLSEESKMEKST